MLPYDGYADTRFAFDARRRAVWRVITAYLQRYVPGDGAIADLGSGYCDFINSVRAARRWAVDLFLDPGRYADDGVVPLCRDVADLTPIPDESLDAVFASNLLEHLDDAKLVDTMAAVRVKLCEGGRIILIQPNYYYCYRNYFDDYTHCRVFTHVSLPDFLRAQGFEVERIAPRFLPFSMKNRLPKWPALVWAYLRSPWKPLGRQMLVIARKASCQAVPQGAVELPRSEVAAADDSPD